MSAEAKLLPCPFCGGDFVAQGASGGYISVWCDCGSRGPEIKFPEDCDPLPPIQECYAAWNRRSTTPHTEAVSTRDGDSPSKDDLIRIALHAFDDGVGDPNDYHRRMGKALDAVVAVLARKNADPVVIDTSISTETKAALDAIDDNIRNAVVHASTTFFGATSPQEPAPEEKL